MLLRYYQLHIVSSRLRPPWGGLISRLMTPQTFISAWTGLFDPVDWACMGPLVAVLCSLCFNCVWSPCNVSVSHEKPNVLVVHYCCVFIGLSIISVSEQMGFSLFWAFAVVSSTCCSNAIPHSNETFQEFCWLVLEGRFVLFSVKLHVVMRIRDD